MWKKVQRLMAMTLLFLMIINVVPTSIPIAHGATGPKVQIRNIYEGFERTEKIITIEDNIMAGWSEKGLSLMTNEGMKAVNNAETFGSRIIQASVNARWNIESILLTGKDSDDKDTDKSYTNINEGTLVINELESSSIGINDTIIALGSEQLSSIVDNKEQYSIRVGGVEAEAFKINVDKDKIEIKPKGTNAQFTPGRNQDITITRKVKLGSGASEYELENIFVYKDAITIVGSLNLDGITMFPTAGEVGSVVEFTRSTFPQQNYDIYFIENLNDPSLFTESNRGKRFQYAASGDRAVISIEVPNIDTGAYHIVFTNPNSQNVGIDRQYVLDQQFNVIRVGAKPNIEGIQPSRAPAMTPTDVEITGYLFTKVNIPGLTLKGTEIERKEIGGILEHLEYQDGGSLTLTGKSEDAFDVEVKREFRVEIGEPLDVKELEFRKDSENDPNTFKLTTDTITIDGETRVDVVINVITTMTPKDNTKDPITVRHKVVVPNGFTYYPSTESPQVDQVSPYIIPIEESNTGKHYLASSLDELLISIKGSNFLVTRYTEDGRERIRYPRIEIGGIKIDPNLNGEAGMQGDYYKPLSFEVMRGNTIVDGTAGNDKGDRILFRLPAGDQGFPVENPDSSDVGINNPIRESKEFQQTFHRFSEKIHFQIIDRNDFPVIDEVKPSLVSMEGGEPITITGSNLRTGAELYIDNDRVNNITISGDNKTITFIAPPGKQPGETQLQVINPGGGIATHPFTYTTTYTQPGLTLINPREGTKDTLVNLKGSNLLEADPTVVVDNINDINEFLMYRLIGSRILMDGHDINDYNMGSNGQIQLTPFPRSGGTVGEDMFIEKDNEVTLGNSFNSVILRDDANNKFYRISRNVQNQYSIEDGLGGRYNIRVSNGKIQAVRGSNRYDIDQTTKGILELKDSSGNTYKTLKAYTPFLIEEVDGYDKITGNRVEFIDSGTLLFEVPNLSKSPWTGAGLYDVTVINPDTKSVTLKNVFNYYPLPRTIPKVIDMIPEEGPESGGNKLTLLAPEEDNVGFTDTSTSKTKVFIGSQEVPSNQVIISPNGREISLTVPAYYENIKEQGTNKVTVPVVLLNPDGGSFHISYSEPIEVNRKDLDGQDHRKTLRGYTYVVPTSTPRIDEVIAKEGSADGGYVVEIFGFDFRDYRQVIDSDGNISETIKADKNDKKPSSYKPGEEVLASPLYPKVYFGDREAEILEFAYEYMQVIIPPGQGSVDVHLMNDDSGISNKVKFNYKTSQPTINSVSPAQGNRRGGDTVDIEGRDFQEGNINLLKSGYDEDDNSLRESKKMALVKVGSRSNLDLPREHENSGVIRSSRATVNLAGGLSVRYNAAETGSAEVIIEDRGKTYRHTYKGLPDGAFYINTKDLKSGDEVYPYEELIKIQISNNRLLVEGGYAPEVTYRSSQHLSVTMPSYYTIGNVNLEVVNPDGGKARGNFEYKNPDSNPHITNVTREGDRGPIEDNREGYGKVKVLQLNYKGGNTVSITGGDFRENATIEIAGVGSPIKINSGDISYDLPSRLTFTMPQVPETSVGKEKLYRVIVSNQDGGFASSDKLDPPIYIEFIKGESEPSLGNITPDRGPATGGTRVKITGNDFRKSMEGFEGEVLKVFFGESAVNYVEGKEDENIEIVDYKTIYVTVPVGKTLGTVPVRVENPDGSLATPPMEYTYISKPKISSMDPLSVFVNDKETEITISGEMFMSGAKVVLGGEIKGLREVQPEDTVQGTGITGVKDGVNQEVSVVGGILASPVTVEDDGTMKVQFDENLELKNTSIIIINPDGGISDPYDDFDYKLPVPTKPLVLEAIPGYESTVQLVWSDSSPEILNAADRYEVYAKLSSDKNYTFVGDTKDAEFLIKGLEVNTRYDFMVRALNRYGSALEFAEASTRTLTLREDDKLQDKIDELDKIADKLKKEGKEEIIGGAVIKTIGTEKIASSGGLYTIDFSLSKYKGRDKFIVALPVSILPSLNRNLMITDGKANLTFHPRNLYTREAIEGARSNPDDAYVRVVFERVIGQEATKLQTAIPRTKQRASGIYGLDFQLQTGKNITNIRQMLQPGSLSINFDSRSYPNAKKDRLNMTKYDISAHQFRNTGSGNYASPQMKSQYMLLSDR